MCVDHLILNGFSPGVVLFGLKINLSKFHDTLLNGKNKACAVTGGGRTWLLIILRMDTMYVILFNMVVA